MSEGGCTVNCSNVLDGESGNACCQPVQNLLSSILLSKNIKIETYRSIILPIVSFGCTTWSLTLREERRLRVFGTGVLRKIFGTGRDKVTGECRRLRNEELCDLYALPRVIWVVMKEELDGRGM